MDEIIKWYDLEKSCGGQGYLLVYFLLTPFKMNKHIL